MRHLREILIFDTQFEHLTIFNTQFNRSSKFDIKPTNFFSAGDSPNFPSFYFFSYCLLHMLMDRFAPDLIFLFFLSLVFLLPDQTLYLVLLLPDQTLSLSVAKNKPLALL